MAHVQMVGTIRSAALPVKITNGCSLATTLCRTARANCFATILSKDHLSKLLARLMILLLTQRDILRILTLNEINLSYSLIMLSSIKRARVYPKLLC